MPNNYDFIDAHGSIITARSSVTSGSQHEPYIIITSMPGLTTTPSGNQSVSGTVNIGNAPSIYGNISGSVLTQQSGTVIGSVINANPSSLLTGASIFGQLPAGTAILGSIAVLQGTNPWAIGSVYGNISGSVVTQQSGVVIGSVINSNPSSLLTGASIYGQLPAGTAVLGSIAVLQGTNPWNIASVYGNISGSVLSQQLGTRIGSVVNSIPSSLLSGVHGHRNDAVASYLGGDLSWRPIATDSAGRIVTKFFAPEESRVEGYISLTSTSMTTLVAAAGAGLRNYITDIWIANTGAAATLVTFSSGGGASVLGYTIAPAGSGSNLQGLTTPIRTNANETFGIQAGTSTSTLYATVKGFKAP